MIKEIYNIFWCVVIFLIINVGKIVDIQFKFLFEKNKVFIEVGENVLNKVVGYLIFVYFVLFYVEVR